MNKPPDKPPRHQDYELLVMSRIERMLGNLPDDTARSRVIAYLASRHQTSMARSATCNVPPLSAPPRPT